MTKEEVKYTLIHMYRQCIWGNECEEYGCSNCEDALNMAIESLQEPKTIIGIDIPYGSDKGLATLFKGKDDKMVLEEVKEIVSVVRCKDCRYWCKKMNKCNRCPSISGNWGTNDFCSYGERKGGDDE